MNNYEVKVVLLGKVGVGKTWLVERYMNNRCSETNMTIGAAFSSKHVAINGKMIKLNIWDTAGAERFEAMAQSYYRGAGAAIVCYDITDYSSLEKVWFWTKQLQDNVEHCNIYFCGTKKDMVDELQVMRQISMEHLEHYASEIKSDIIETSSKTGENVRYLFNKIAEDSIKKLSEEKLPQSLIRTEEIVEDLTVRKKKRQLKCCKMS